MLMVSICITAYNHEEYISQAVESVLNQHVDFEYEIIIGEDDSEDNTRSIVKEYQDRYPDKIRLFLNSRKDVIYINGRPCGLWNFYNNIRNAKGKYIALLDGDDFWTEPDKLKRQIAALEQHPDCTICFHDSFMLMEKGANQSYLETLEIKRQARYTIEDILFRNFMPTGSVVFRNRFISVLPKVAFTIMAGDWFLHILNAQHGDIIYIDRVMSCYRVHQQGLWTSLGVDGMLREKIGIYERIDGYLGRKYTELIMRRIEACTSQLNDLVSNNHSIC